MVCAYATYDWVNEQAFVKKEAYFQFAKIIELQLKEMEIVC